MREVREVREVRWVRSTRAILRWQSEEWLGCCIAGRMGVRRFEELIAWQLADELHRQVLEFSDTAPASEDRDFCNQIRRATRSARANVAEGFGRYYQGEFVRYLRIAAASLHETKDHLHEARDRRFVTEARHLELVRLMLRALKANIRLQQALRRRDGS